MKSCHILTLQLWLILIPCLAPAAIRPTPSVTTFSLPTISASLTVAIDNFSVSFEPSGSGVTQYLITPLNAKPSVDDPRWSPTPPLIYSFLSNGKKTLYAWVKDADGNISDSVAATVMVNAPDGRDIPKVSAGGKSFAISSDGNLWGWGNNILTPTVISSDRGWKDVSGFYYVYSGINKNGGLCDLSSSSYDQTCNTQDAWAHIDYSGFYFHVGIKSDGSLWTWGYVTGHESPTRIGNDSDWIKANASLALKKDGSLWKWVINPASVDLPNINQIPERVDGDNDWLDIAHGDRWSFALKSDGTLWAWDHSTPFSLIRIGYDNNWVSISSGEGHHAAVKNDGTLWTWGWNYFGELGSGNNDWQIIPTRVGSDNNWIKAVAGHDYTLGEKADGTLWGWGDNASGNLGDSTTINKLSPVPIMDLGSCLTINDGSPAINSASATLWTSNFRGWIRMQFSEDGTAWSAPESYASSKIWRFADGDGLKQLFVRYQNVVGQWATACSASVSLDTVAPIISFLNPFDNSIIFQKTVVITGNVSEISTVQARTGDGIWQTAQMNGTDFTVSLNLSTNQSIIDVVATDSAGNSTLKQIAVTQIPINGACGSSHNEVFASAPSTALCTRGAASTVAGNGPWSWTCSGMYGGTNDNCSASVGVGLNLSFSGLGGGSVNGDISCTSGSLCGQRAFATGEVVTLVAVPDLISVFRGWTGVCNGTGNCSIFLNAIGGNKSVTAIFDLADKARIASSGYTSFADAYTAASRPSTTIMLLEDTLPLSTDINKSLVLEGGYKADFSRTANGYSTLQGKMMIGTGKVIMDRIILR